MSREISFFVSLGLTLLLILTLFWVSGKYYEVWVAEAEIARLERKLVETRAVNETGPCGDKRLVVLDDYSVAVAGKIIGIWYLPSFSFHGKDDGSLKVWIGHGRDRNILMDRPAKRATGSHIYNEP